MKSPSLKNVFSAGAVLAACCAFGERIELKTAQAKCAVETKGARVVSYATAADGEILWTDTTGTVSPEWTHGGIPICWPWFSNHPAGLHGFGWKSDFSVLKKTETPGKSTLVLGLRTESLELEYTIVLEDELRLEMVTRNLSENSIRLSAAFHPYFRVADAQACRVSGATPEPFAISGAMDCAFVAPKGSFACYRLADAVKNRTILVKADNAPWVNVWNPGEGHPDARHFVCVEPCIRSVAPVTVAPGGWHVMKLGVEVRPGAKLTGFAGADPRYPGSEEVRYREPFKVLFIGAHPDDAEYDFGPATVKLLRQGAKVTFVSVCNGDNGHQTMTPEALAARRYLETQTSAKVYGISRYIVMGEHDCLVEPTVDLRARVTRLIRDIAPNMIVTHRTCDYHADHRATGQVVQDSTYLIGVPLFAHESPVPEVLPFIVYGGDGFTEPRPFRADLVCGDDDVMDTLLEAWACHESQEFEWLPPEYGFDPAKDIPPASDHAGRVAFLRDHMMPGRPTGNGRRHRREIDEAWGGKGPTYAEVFELCEYARRPVPKEIAFLRSLPNVKWIGEEPKLFKKGESQKTSAKV